MPPKEAKKSANIRVRMAPSPTGPFHIGSARTALFNWLFARAHGGEFILRIEDTDKARSEKRYEEDILAGLAWLGLDWDEGPQPGGGDRGGHGPYRQSERTGIYKKYLETLLAKGDAYYCYCTKEELEAQRDAMAAQGLPPRYSGRCRALKTAPEGRTPQVIRFKVPETTVVFNDLVRGKVSFDAGLFGDMVIAKDLETPLYNFTVVVDDELMAITHVIRGEDHLSNTPKQILFARALGFREPHYAHIPLILNPDRSKMSKRFADTALADYRAKGYLPAAMVNFLAFLGWHPKQDQEILTIEDLAAQFDLARVQPSGAVFNQEKLDWMNREYLKAMDDAKILMLAAPFFSKDQAARGEAFLKKIIAVERDRATTLADFAAQGAFFFEVPDYAPELLIWKNSTAEEALAALKQLAAELKKIGDGQFTRAAIAAASTTVIETGRKRGAVLWPLRVALSGLAASPDPIEIADVIGKEETLTRIGIAVKKLEIKS